MNYLSKCGLLILLVSPFAMANTLLDELSLCAKNIDNLQRLTCYDILAKKANNNLAKQHQTPSQVTVIEPLDNATEVLQKSQPKPTPVNLEQPKGSPSTELQQSVNISKKAEVTEQQLSNFGQEDKQRSKNLIKQIQATIINIKKAPRGELIVSLDNGQIWRQTDNTHLTLKKDQLVIIKRGAFGSFFIRKKNTNKGIRAKRVK